MRHRLVAIAMVLGSLAAVVPAGTSSAAGATAISTGVEPCQDVVVVGARGSGEPSDGLGVGRMVRRVVETYASSVPGYRVGRYAVTYPAQNVDLLVTGNQRLYWDGFDDGYLDALKFMTKRLKRCPTERYVFVGYSQGAMLLHRVVAGSVGQLLGGQRIDGVVLIGDGDRIPYEGGWSRGSSPNSNGQQRGIASMMSEVTTETFRQVQRPIGRSIRNQYFSVCNERDVVCDTADWATWAGLRVATGVLSYQHLQAAIGAFDGGVKAHESYASGSLLPDVAREVARITRSRPRTAAMGLVSVNPPPASIGQQYRWEVQSEGGARPYRYSLFRSQLPRGLTMSGSGLISGTPTTRPAKGFAEFTIRSTDANGQFVNQYVRLPFARAAGTCPVQTSLDTTECSTLHEIRSLLRDREMLWPVGDDPCWWLDVECRDGHVVRLGLSGGEAGSLPGSIGNLSRLERLDVSGNGLRSLPSSMSRLVRLKHLELSGNRGLELPRWLVDLPVLEHLRLYSMDLVSVPDWIGDMPSLEHLMLGWNELTSLPSSLRRLTALDELDLQSNNLSEVPAWVGDLSSLRVLSLSNNRVTRLPGSITHLQKLEQIILDGNAVTALPADLGRLSMLQRLSVIGNRLTSLPTSLGQLTHLEGLWARGNLLEGDISGWARPLMTSASRLSFLNLDDNKCLDVGNDAELASWLDEQGSGWRSGCA